MRRLELRTAELERRLSMDSTDSGTPGRCRRPVTTVTAPWLLLLPGQPESPDRMSFQAFCGLQRRGHRLGCFEAGGGLVEVGGGEVVGDAEPAVFAFDPP